MERQQAFTILASAGASAAMAAALLFLWLPAAAPPGPTDDAGEVAAFRREVELLKDEVAARSNALPPPMVAERVVEIEGGRARDELARRCDELLARCDELERTVAELEGRLAKGAVPTPERLLFPTYGAGRSDGLLQRNSIGSGRFEVGVGFFRGRQSVTAEDIQHLWQQPQASDDH